MAPRWWHRLFLIHSPSQGEVLTTIQEQDPLGGSCRTRVRLKHPCAPQKPRRTAWEGKEVLGIDCTVPPPGQHGTTAKRSPLSLQVLRWTNLVGGNQLPPRPPALWVTFQESILWSGTTKTAGESVGLNHWESHYDRIEGRGLQWLAHTSWQIKFIPINAQVVIPTGGFAHL